MQYKKLLLCILSGIPFQLVSCPSCVGIVNEQTPPFFTEEFYQPTLHEVHQGFKMTGTNR